jgi:branched-chain amino acid transport system ATP-binding protein
MTAALQCRSISVSYGRFNAVDGFSYGFEAGELYGVIGPNGAGKTTLMNVIVGGKAPTSGSVILGGHDVTGLGVARRARLGLGRSFQISKIFAEMSVFENLRLAAQATAFPVQPWWRPASAYRALADQAREMLVTVGLERHADAAADKLSHGDQRALELGLALMTSPTVLLLDEPLAGVGHHGLSEAIDRLARLSEGRTVLLIEHNMNAVMRLAKTVLVMVNGRLVASGAPDEVRRDPAVRDAYLGSDG